MVPDIARLASSASASRSVSPKADEMEQSLLDASAMTDYIGRRPSTSGRDTKRTREYIPNLPTYLPTYLIPQKFTEKCLDASASYYHRFPVPRPPPPSSSPLLECAGEIREQATNAHMRFGPARALSTRIP
jgi:hypothetical protein